MYVEYYHATDLHDSMQVYKSILIEEIPLLSRNLIFYLRSNPGKYQSVYTFGATLYGPIIKLTGLGHPCY